MATETSCFKKSLVNPNELNEKNEIINLRIDSIDYYQLEKE